MFSNLLSGLHFFLPFKVCSFKRSTSRREQKARPPHHGAARRQRKLTVTLFIMTVVSLLMWLPYVVTTFVKFTTNSFKSISYQKELRLNLALIVLFNANSLVNPILYAIRMPDFRRALLSLFRRQQNQMIGHDILLHRL